MRGFRAHEFLSYDGPARPAKDVLPGVLGAAPRLAQLRHSRLLQPPRGVGRTGHPERRHIEPREHKPTITGACWTSDEGTGVVVGNRAACGTAAAAVEATGAVD